jgi:NadR type nicotinamide-nucleotide adenylyltransferase
LNKLKKIAVIGPESTGKSTLCYQLAEHFHTPWVPEFAREYLNKNSTAYTYEELLVIAKGQVELEENYSGRISREPLQPGDDQLLFIDTDMHVMQVWCEFAFGNCHNWILKQIADRRYDLYLLCNTDLPWIKDELREYPDADTRNKLYWFYKEQMVNQYTPWVDISGNYQERLHLAIQAISNQLH